VAILGEGLDADRDTVISKLQAAGIDARRLYYPTHQLPPYKALARDRTFPVADRLAARGVCLPTWSGLTAQDVQYVSEQLKAAIRP
jgi:perosamine synthetase